ncbi:MAG: hypothetical protein D6798_01565 [Deltaproteobacteria bacterium]|nr:MAG: hypothetical protein D6798_01565 [Deltaproteobacteria bacterium]
MLISGPPLSSPPVDTLGRAVLRLAEMDQPWLTVHRDPERHAWTGPALLDLARRWRDAARARGLRQGDRAVVLMPNDERFVAAFFGLQLAGCAPVPLAWPSTLANKQQALAPLRPIVEVADPRVILTTPEVTTDWPWPFVTEPAAAATGDDVLAGPDDPAFLQFTSGSMGRPRGAVIPQRAAVGCTWSMGSGMGLSPQDVGLSWLPLYHDMGLVGALLCPLLFGFPLHLMRPGEFLLHPRRWLDHAAEFRVTVAAAPDFGWRLVARRVRDYDRDLSSWRVGLDGAEPVHRSTLDAVHQRLGPAGLPAGTPRPAYGLAEGTLGVCIYDPDRPAPDLEWNGRQVPSVGGPLPGVSVRTVTATGMECAEGEEGEILVRGPGLMRGYFRDEGQTAAALRDGWLHTGDLGVIAGGQLYVTGRIKDLVIHNGVKLHPYDIERVAAEAADATLNGAAAFTTREGEDEALVVVVEVPRRRSEGVERRVLGALVRQLGIRPNRVLAVPPGQIPRTTSGKVRRPAAAARFGGGHGP